MIFIQRIIFLGTGINDQVSDSLVAQLLFLEAEDPEKDIQIYINSPHFYFLEEQRGKDWLYLILGL